MHFDGWAYKVGDFNVKVGKVTLKPREEFKGFMVEVEYAPVSTATQASPALMVWPDRGCSRLCISQLYQGNELLTSQCSICQYISSL